MNKLRDTLMLAHKILSKEGIDHALIGGLALATLGINRATSDVDLLIEGIHKDKVKNIFLDSQFKLRQETNEVMHFGGVGNLDILLANRPLSKEMLKNAQVLPPFDIKCLGVEDIIGLKIQAYKNDKDREYQDKADIYSLIKKYPNLDWDKVRQYSEIFQEWETIQKMK
jgi:predicted nucleotidyltransferase